MCACDRGHEVSMPQTEKRGDGKKKNYTVPEGYRLEWKSRTLSCFTYQLRCVDSLQSLYHRTDIYIFIVT